MKISTNLILFLIAIKSKAQNISRLVCTGRTISIQTAMHRALNIDPDWYAQDTILIQTGMHRTHNIDPDCYAQDIQY